MLLKSQNQKVWLSSGFSHRELPVPLDQSTLLKTLFSSLLLLLNLIQKRPICSSYIIRRVLHFRTAAEVSVPMQKLELIHPPALHRNNVKELKDPKNFRMIFSTLFVQCKLLYSHILQSWFLPLIKCAIKLESTIFQWKEKKESYQIQ